MNKFAFLSLFALMAVSCGAAPSSNPSSSSSDDYQIRWLSPVGAPTLAFYDQGKNSNWLSTDTPQSVIPTAFSSNGYDAIVFDGTSGLNLISRSGGASHYALARWINELPFYLVSVTHNAEEAIPANATIDAFVQNGTASQALREMAESDWGIGALTAVTYEDGVAAVQANLLRDTSSYDYFVLAEPVYTLTKAALNNRGVTLNLIKDLQSEWGRYHEGAAIPSAGLFVNTDTLSAHPAALSAFVADVDARLDDLVLDPGKVKTTLLAFEEETGNLASQFGVGLPIINQFDTLQQTNKLGFLNQDQTQETVREYANKFAVGIGGSAYAENLFVTI